jgi:hypothetical protein
LFILARYLVERHLDLTGFWVPFVPLWWYFFSTKIQAVKPKTREKLYEMGFLKVLKK